MFLLNDDCKLDYMDVLSVLLQSYNIVDSEWEWYLLFYPFLDFRPSQQNLFQERHNTSISPLYRPCWWSIIWITYPPKSPDTNIFNACFPWHWTKYPFFGESSNTRSWRPPHISLSPPSTGPVRKKPSIAHGVQSIVASSKMLKIQPRVESYRLPRSWFVRARYGGSRNYRKVKFENVGSEPKSQLSTTKIWHGECWNGLQNDENHIPLS